MATYLYDHFLNCLAKIYFLDVGQGDSELVVFPDGITMMTDAGPTDKVLESLGKY